MANRLVEEASAYLRKHKDNPVDWYPWTEEAFERARKEDKPLFISIGYFSCHWCAVMERESFEDETTAEFMNRHFINIKVDREERPDLDKIYQRYYNTLTGEGGGWPLNVYAFPDGLPFYIATYLPKNFSLRSRTFMSLNKEIAASWENERDELFEISSGLSRNLDSSNQIMVKSKSNLSDEILIKEIQRVQDRMDWKHGGILAGDTKFPRFSLLRFLLKEGIKRDAQNLVKFVNLTFNKMSKGGIYDQLGGGISRYSVDHKWEIPHFEKMLYDQAGWIRLAGELYGVTQNDYILYIIEDMLHFLENTLLSDDGVFYSSVDAESEGAEGRYYTFTHDEIKSILDDSYVGFHFNAKWFRLGIGKPEFYLNDDYKIAKKRYGISRLGNFSDPHGNIVGANVLNIKASIPEIAESLNLDRKYVVDRLNLIRQKLYEAQQERIPPDIDKKVITTWNAMLVTGLLEVYEKTQIEKARFLALQCLEFLLDQHVVEDQVLRSSHEDYPNNTPIPGILDDYVFVVEALMKTFEVTNEFQYIEIAQKIQELMDHKFYDPDTEIYYLNESSESSIGRILSAMDDSFQSSLAVEIGNLFKLGSYLENDTYIQRGQSILLRLAEPAAEYEGSMSEYFISAGYYLRYPDEFVIVNDEQTSFRQIILKQYNPERLIYQWPREDNAPFWDVVENRDNQDEPTVFICRGATCTMPLTTEDDVLSELVK